MPRTMFLEGSTRSTRRMMRRPPVSARSASTDRAHSGAGRFGQEPGLVGVRGRRRRWAGRWGQGSRQVGVGEAGAESLGPMLGVKAAGAEAGQPGQELAGGVVGEHAQHVRVGEGDVAEVDRAQVGPPLGQHPAQQREVVVLHQDRGRVGGFGADHVGHGPVVGAVAGPGRMPVPVEAGPAGKVEEVVVDVPEGGVGHDVVGHAVGLGVDGDRAQGERRIEHAAGRHRGLVGRAHGHGDPHGVGVGAGVGCRRRSGAGAAPRPARHHRPAVAGCARRRSGTTAVPGWRRRSCRAWSSANHGPVHGRMRSNAARSTSTAWGRSSCRGRLRWMRSPRSTWARTPGPRCVATSISSAISTP